jgi:hypothetical protein
MRGKIADHTGKRFGKLIAIKLLDKKDWNGSHAKWLCQCDCGNISHVTSNRLAMNKAKSCGCTTRYANGIGNRNNLYRNYIAGAIKRKYSFDLTIDEFHELTQKPCFYCGREPSQKITTKTNNGPFIYNGIDRIDNNLGYTLSNSRTCCKECNMAKGSLSEQDFLILIKKIFNKHLKFI